MLDEVSSYGVSIKAVLFKGVTLNSAGRSVSELIYLSIELKALLCETLFGLVVLIGQLKNASA